MSLKLGTATVEPHAVAWRRAWKRPWGAGNNSTGVKRKLDGAQRLTWTCSQPPEGRAGWSCDCWRTNWLNAR